MKKNLLNVFMLLVFPISNTIGQTTITFPIVGTAQSTSFNDSTMISAPVEGDDFFGQNANYPGTTPSYTDNGNGTVTDNVTGLMWQNTFDHNGDGSIDYDDKLTYDEILALPKTCKTGGYTDWRVPTIKEQYSLMMFSGLDISGYEGTSTDSLIPFINTDYFDFNYGDTDAGERLIDVQCASTNVSVGNTTEMVFGVNFADGRIKGYGTSMRGEEKKFNYLLCRGNSTYGKNSFADNGNGTITDTATGLMWMQDDSKEGMKWKEALSYAEKFTYAGKSDWRLPDAKELQGIVDYSRSPQSSSSAAIDSVFNCTSITNEAGELDYPYYWTSTTHANMSEGSEGAWGAYIAFGRAMGNESLPTGPGPMGMSTKSAAVTWTDVHGAGAQRSDPKNGDPDDYPTGNGPQGDAIRVYNYVRLVRNVEGTTTSAPTIDKDLNNIKIFPNPAAMQFTITSDKEISRIEILNLSGSVVSSNTVNKYSSSINIEHFSNGIYIVRIYNENENIPTTKKLIKDF